MIRQIKVRIVIGIESLCGLTGHHWCHRIAGMSARLDERWETGCWVVVSEQADV